MARLCCHQASVCPSQYPRIRLLPMLIPDAGSSWIIKGEPQHPRPSLGETWTDLSVSWHSRQSRGCSRLLQPYALELLCCNQTGQKIQYYFLKAVRTLEEPAPPWRHLPPESRRVPLRSPSSLCTAWLLELRNCVWVPLGWAGSSAPG